MDGETATDKAAIIEICERLMDRMWDGKPKYHAQIQGKPHRWACGESIDEAVGDLVRCHHDRFGLTIMILDGVQAR